MLYLKSIMLDKFKSFRRTELLFSRGFTCVVGPNGSGKSVIFDALMFGLGEPSLQTLRVDRLEELINRNIKRKRDEPTVAHLRMDFEGEGKAVTVVKSIRSDGKTAYRLNDKAMTRKEVVEFLSSEGVRADDTTTIAQGEINTYATLNSRQRRELIDTAAGISQFEGKKQEALKELDKVDNKINEAKVALNERQGFLDGLEKEKEAAESYMKMNSRMKNLRYSVLVARKDLLKSSNDAYTKELAILDSKKNESSFKLNEFKTKRDQLAEERQQLTKELNKINSASGETASKVENLTRELAKLEVEIPSIQKSIDDNKLFISQSESGLSAANDKIKANNQAIDKLNRGIAAAEAELAKLGGVPEEGVDYDKELKDAGILAEESENRMIDIQGYISKLQADLSSASSKRADLESMYESLERNSELITERKKSKEAEISSVKQAITDMISTIARLDQENSKIKKRLYAIDGEMLTFIEQRAILQQREGNLSAKISEKFSDKDGFYGKASGLCHYDSKNACAVEVAASGRFEYFIVDSIAVASKIIDYLKKGNLGRATFIPISDLKSETQAPSEKGIVPVIDVVKFEGKFAKVFSYIFSNTYLIPDANDAKKYGIGKHRYVTLEGELIEQSGTVSGGSSRRVSLASIENKIRLLETEKEKARKESDIAEVSLHDAEKEKALLDMQVENLSSELKKAVEEFTSAIRQQSDIASQIKKKSEEEAKIGTEILNKDKEKLDVVTALNRSKQVQASIYSKVSAVSRSFSKAGKYKQEREKADRLRHESEENKISKASLDTEAQMLGKKASELSSDIDQRHRQMKELKSQLQDKELRKEVLLKSRGDIEKEMKNKNESSRQLYDRLTAIDEEVGRLSMEIGKLDSDAANFDRQINDLRIKMSQTGTRLNDITAELSTSQPGLDLVNGSPEEMDAEANIIALKINDLGNINLKAPEVYEEKKKFAEEAQSRVSTLQAEKEAVLRMMEEIDSKKLQTFMDMLNQVNKNFAKLYEYVFPGKVAIMLEDESDPLNSGIFIHMNDGKSDIPLKSLSGGQKSMIALMMLFSIHLCKKSSLYLFDEVDAALDSENAKLLSKLIKQMSETAQFIVISHNNSLIVNADAAIGITMDEAKESRAIGLEISSTAMSKQQ